MIAVAPLFGRELDAIERKGSGSVPHLFEKLTLRGVVLRNRIAVSPMMQYSAVDGHATDWHLVHLGSRAVGGAGLVSTESTCVSPEGRNSLGDLGLWKDSQIDGHRRIVDFVRAQGTVPAVQLGHGGRKAGKRATWQKDVAGRVGAALSSEEGAWSIVAPSAIRFDDLSHTPSVISERDIAGLVEAYRSAAERAVCAGYDWVEIHSAHGYLLHNFLSPLSNTRSDSYGGSLENRSRFLRQIVCGCRAALGEHKVLAVRLSYTDWEPSGWSIEETVALAKALKTDGVDLIDVSSGGTTPSAKIPVGPGYQLPGAIAVKSQVDIAVGAVGLITEPEQADEIIRKGQADIVYLARELLRSPYWPLEAARKLGHIPALHVPAQYELAHRMEPRPAIVETPRNLPLLSQS